MHRWVFLAAVVAVALAGCGSSIGPEAASVSPTPASSSAPVRQPPPAQALPGFTLTPAEGVEPLRTSTSIGVLEWTTYDFPAGAQWYDVGNTVHGPVAVPSGDSQLWWATDNTTWAGSTTVIDPHGLTLDGQDVVIFDGGAVRYTWEGEAGWVAADILDVQDVARMTFGPKGAVAAEGSGTGVDYYFAPDSTHFSKARSGPSKETLTGTDSECRSLGEGGSDSPGPLLATSTGFVALTAANPDQWDQTSACSPVVWTSPDGDVWTLTSPGSPFGTGSAVDYVAERDGRFVATGTTGSSRPPWAAVWTSPDGIHWQPSDLDVGTTQNLTVSTGPLGWIVTGTNLSESSTQDQMWTSPDGLVWAGPYPLPAGFTSGYDPLQLAIGSDSIFGIGGRYGAPIPVVAQVID